MIPVQHTSLHAAHESSQGFLHGRCILIADDSAAIRFVAATALRAQGALVQEVSDGPAAVETALSGCFDLILMDVQLPGMDGLEATLKLRKSGLHKIPILALTGSVGEALEACIAVGMNDILHKPFTPAMLIGKCVRLTAPATAAPGATENLHSIAPEEGTLFSAESLRALCGGDTALMQRLLGIAVQELPFAAEQMREAYSSGYFEQIARLAHRVRPCVEGLGIPGLPHKLLRIETLIADKAASSQIGYFLSAAADELERVARQIISAR